MEKQEKKEPDTERILKAHNMLAEFFEMNGFTTHEALLGMTYLIQHIFLEDGVSPKKFDGFIQLESKIYKRRYRLRHPK